MPVNLYYTQKVRGFQRESAKYSTESVEIRLKRTRVRNLQVIGKIANTGVYNCGKANFQKTRNCNLKSISPNSKLC
jgi:hypothetical protein